MRVCVFVPCVSLVPTFPWRLGEGGAILLKDYVSKQRLPGP